MKHHKLTVLTEGDEEGYYVAAVPSLRAVIGKLKPSIRS
jgi:predicted RNase H-like HicB family nuclease